MFRISGKTLAELNLPNTCPSCFKVRVNLESQLPLDSKNRNKVPYQMPFPGVFSAFDSHIKSVVNQQFTKNRSAPSWFPDLGKKIVAIEKPPSWQEFNTYFPEFGIKLTGALDTILKLDDDSFAFGDYKTATITDTQDKLQPLYQGQLHAYKSIAEKLNIFQPVSMLVLIYTEPVSLNVNDNHYEAADFNTRFHIHFRVVKKEVEIIPNLTFTLMKKLNDIMKNPNPPKLETCINCKLRDRLYNEEKKLRAGIDYTSGVQ